MPTAVETTAKVEQFLDNVDLFDDLVNGPPGTVVQTRNGPVQSAPSAIAGLAASSAEAAASAQTAQNASNSALAAGRYRATKAAAEAAFPTVGSMIAYLASGVLTFAERTAGGSTVLPDTAQPLTKSTGVSKTGAETITGSKTFIGAFSIAANGSRVGITDTGTPIVPQALVEIKGTGVTTGGLRVSERWTATTALPYQNNDTILIETFNNILSDSANYSWSSSNPNAYNNIPANVHDSGERVGVYGWATSVHIPGLYEHRGRLTSQIGVRGRAGFQGPGHPSTGRIDSAVGVRGEIRADSAGGSTISSARAGYFTTLIEPGSGIVQNNYAVYAEASGGQNATWGYFSPAGNMFQYDRAWFGTGAFNEALIPQSTAHINSRGGLPNAFSWGNGDPTGYGSFLFAYASNGAPAIGFCCEASPSGNTVLTRGKLGTMISNDLAGSMVFSRVSNPNAGSQTPIESARFTASGQLVLSNSLRTGSYTVATVPSAAAHGPGASIFVSDEVGGSVPAFSDGTNWLRVTDRAIIS